MKFHYWKQLLLILICSAGIYSSKFFINNAKEKPQSDKITETSNNKQIQFSNEDSFFSSPTTNSEVDLSFTGLDLEDSVLKEAILENIDHEILNNVHRVIDNALKILEEEEKLKPAKNIEARKKLKVALILIDHSREKAERKVKEILNSDELEISILPNSIFNGTDPKPKAQSVDEVLTVAASMLSVLGTISTIILSWREDIREAQAEIQKLKEQQPKLYIPYRRTYS